MDVVVKAFLHGASSLLEVMGTSNTIMLPMTSGVTLPIGRSRAPLKRREDGPS